MTVTALETLDKWSHLLKTFQQRLGSYFARSEAYQVAFNYIQALLSTVERKRWQVAEHVSDANPY